MMKYTGWKARILTCGSCSLLSPDIVRQLRVDAERAAKMLLILKISDR